MASNSLSNNMNASVSTVVDKPISNPDDHSSPEKDIAAQDLEANSSSTRAAQAEVPSANQQLQDFGPKTPLTPVRRVCVFMGIFVTLFLAALDQTIVTTTLPSIAKEFNNFSDISWVGTAYLLTTTAVQPLYGVAADLAGRKRAM